MIMYIFSKQDKYNDSLVILGIVRKLLKIKIQHKNNGHVNIARKKDIAKLVFFEVFFLSGMKFGPFFLFEMLFFLKQKKENDSSNKMGIVRKLLTRQMQRKKNIHKKHSTTGAMTF